MAAKKKDRKSKDDFVHMWAESMVPELTLSQVMHLHTIERHCAQDGFHGAESAYVPLEKELAAFGLVEMTDEELVHLKPTDAGIYVLKRMRELGWL